MLVDILKKYIFSENYFKQAPQYVIDEEEEDVGEKLVRTCIPISQEKLDNEDFEDILNHKVSDPHSGRKKTLLKAYWDVMPERVQINYPEKETSKGRH